MKPSQPPAMPTAQFTAPTLNLNSAEFFVHHFWILPLMFCATFPFSTTLIIFTIILPMIIYRFFSCWFKFALSCIMLFYELCGWTANLKLLTAEWWNPPPGVRTLKTGSAPGGFVYVLATQLNCILAISFLPAVLPPTKHSCQALICSSSQSWLKLHTVRQELKAVLAKLQSCCCGCVVTHLPDIPDSHSAAMHAPLTGNAPDCIEVLAAVQG